MIFGMEVTWEKGNNRVSVTFKVKAGLATQMHINMHIYMRQKSSPKLSLLACRGI